LKWVATHLGLHLNNPTLKQSKQVYLLKILAI